MRGREHKDIVTHSKSMRTHVRTRMNLAMGNQLKKEASSDYGTTGLPNPFSTT